MGSDCSQSQGYLVSNAWRERYTELPGSSELAVPGEHTKPEQLG